MFCLFSNRHPATERSLRTCVDLPVAARLASNPGAIHANIDDVQALVVVISLASFQGPGNGRSDTAAVAQFQAEIDKYMAIRRGLADEVSGPTPNSSASELTRASDALAAAIQRRRPNAKPGALFTPAIAAALKQRVSDAIRAANLGPALSGIDDEGVGVKSPSVYLRFPAAAQMATMPPSLLAALPPLPKELEYRIVGTHLVLRDVDAALVIDFVPDAVPRK